MPERRKGSGDKSLDLELRDKIIETHNDVKHLVEWAKTHDTSDNDRFTLANKKIDFVRDFAQKHIYIGLGGITVVMIILKLFLK